jgi:asparagine synthase (glutamine-hydrolysing)
VLQAARAVLADVPAYAEGPWDEEALWLAGPDALHTDVRPPRQQPLRAESGGYYTLRSGSGFAFIRCARFRHRPGHADQLHVDLWLRGVNLAVDAGTYGYNADVAWAKDLNGTAVHNTVTVDGADQSTKVSRFLSYPWPEGRVRSTAADASRGYFEGEHSAYERLVPPVTHRRAIIALADDAWVVIDALLSRGPHAYRVHWLLADAPYDWDPSTATLAFRGAGPSFEVRMGTAGDVGVVSLVRAEVDGARGWRAPGYGRREPALSLALEVTAATTWCWTVFSAVPALVTREANRLDVHGADWRAEIAVNTSSVEPLAVATRHVIGAAFAAPQAGAV